MDFLTAKQIIQTGNYDCLYAFMYGRMFDNVMLNAGRSREARPAKIIKLKKKEIEMDRKGLGFFLVWGFPGPDYNYYLYSDYNYSWSFSEDELLFAQKLNGKNGSAEHACQRKKPGPSWMRLSLSRPLNPESQFRPIHRRSGRSCTSLKKQRTNLSEIQPAKGEPKWKSMI